MKMNASAKIAHRIYKLGLANMENLDKRWRLSEWKMEAAHRG